MWYLSLFLAAALSYATPATAATGIGGTITTTMWTKANGPYYVLNAITVPAGNTLTIEPGVDVIFEADVQFTVQGRLHAVGTESDSIRFIKGSAAQWSGITLSEGDTSTLGYVRISHVSSARAGLNVTTSTRVGMMNVKISGNGGGGFSLSAARATLTNCTITGNSAASYGGGLYALNSSTLTLTNCTISGNAARQYGGGGLYTSSSSTVTLTNCTISGNSARGGGGVRVHSSTVTLTNCTISGNATWDDGGGLYTSSSSTATLTNCTISGNVAGRYGGGVYTFSSSTVTLTNCTISGNTARYGGGGLGADRNSITRLMACTISGNTGYYGGGFYVRRGSTLVLASSILWGNSPFDFYNSREFSGTVSATYSDISMQVSVPLPGEGNIYANPLFVDPANGDYRLQTGSPCIDAGDPNSPRDPDGSRADMGALPYGFPSRRAR